MPKETDTSRIAVVRITRIFEPLDYGIGPADPEMRRGEHFELSTPAMKSESQLPARQYVEQAPPHGEPSLTAHIHLHIVDGVAVDQIEVAPFVRLMFSGRELNQILRPQIRVRAVLSGRQVQPKRIELRHLSGDAFTVSAE